MKTMQNWSERVLEGQIAVTSKKLSNESLSEQEKAALADYLKQLQDEKSRRAQK